MINQIAPLPYDMGNAGDLIKHGLLAEFAQWWSRCERRSLRFLDPFAGSPWVSPPHPEVTRRVVALPPCALCDAQPHVRDRYYGSAYVVLNASRAAGCTAEVFVSDSDPDARRAFQGSCLQPLSWPGFSPADSFSILGTDIEADLLLLDPYADFLRDTAPTVIPKLARVAERMACALFVLNLDPTNRVGRRYHDLRTRHLSHAWSLRCPRLPDRGVRGESRYEVEVLLAWRRFDAHPLGERLQRYAASLSMVLDAQVTFSGGAPHRQRED